MWDTLLDLLFPRRSLSGELGRWVTPEEMVKLISFPLRLDAPVLRQMGVRHLDRIVAASSYAHCPLLRKAIHTFKYRRILGLCDALGRLIADASALLSAGEDAVLCPVPLHWVREFHRGFNQAALLAASVSEARSWPVRTLLCRRWSPGSQVKRSHEERRKAMRGCFLGIADCLPRHVVLVDDVSTTGATLDECARVLRERGVERVEGLVLAQGGGNKRNKEK